MAASGAYPSRVQDQSGMGSFLGWPSAFARWLWGVQSLRREPLERAELMPRFRNVCISREAGAGGGTIGRLVAARLGWRVYDHEIVEAIAAGMGVSTDEVKILDELAPSVAQDWILPLREEHYAPQEAYLDHLAKLIEAIGKAGDSVIVGRGAGLMLPREETLTVRIIAPLSVRAEHLAEVLHITPRTGKRAAVDLDRRRSKFVRVMHRADAQDSHNYDIVLDSASLGPKMAAEMIIHAVELGLPFQSAPVIVKHDAWPQPPMHDEPPTNIDA